MPPPWRQLRRHPLGKSPAMMSHVCYFSTSLQTWAPQEKAWLAFLVLPPECRLVEYTVGTQSGLSSLTVNEQATRRDFLFATWESRISPASLPPRGHSEPWLNKAHGIAYNTIKGITIAAFRIWERSRDKFRYQGSWTYFLICVDFDAITMQILPFL